jgi:hypothetical protein
LDLFDQPDTFLAQVIKRLAADADVFVQNMRPGVIDKLGVGARPRAVASFRSFAHQPGVFCTDDREWKVQGRVRVTSITTRLEFSGPLSRKRWAFSIQAL